MVSYIDNTRYTLNVALKKSIENFEKNVKGEYICSTEKGIKVKIFNKYTNQYTLVLVKSTRTKLNFENLNSTATFEFNNINKNNIKYAYIYYNQINSIIHTLNIIKKLTKNDLIKESNSNNKTLFDNEG
ncbi:MAG: hypothetical protein ACK5NF_04005 [Bacilli bacterium]